jgi:hypothetical protein
VLEEKSHRGALEHLGALATVRLYRNDRQIKRVTCCEEESAQVAYTVTVRPLSSFERARPGTTASPSAESRAPTD